MAIPIKSPPVLYGEAARQFEEKRKHMTERKTKEEVRESMRRTLAMLAKYDNPYKENTKKVTIFANGNEFDNHKNKILCAQY
jgi:hypothetical protein